MHGARVIALRGNFDQALELVRELAKRRPIALVNSVNPFRLEGQKTASFEILDELGEIDALCIPVGNAGNVTAYWKGFTGARLARRACSATRPRARRRSCTARRSRRPRRSRARSGSATPPAGRRRWTPSRARAGRSRAVTDAQILDAYRFLAREEGVFCEPASAAGVAGLLANGAEGAERIACVLTGHGLKDPQTALAQAGSVVPCEPDIAAVERADPDASGAGWSGCRRRRPTSGRASTCWPPRSACTWRSRWRRPGRFARPHRPADRPRPAQPGRARRSRRCTRPTTSSSRSAPTCRSRAGSGRARRPTWPGLMAADSIFELDAAAAGRRDPARGPSRTTPRRRCWAASWCASARARRASRSRPGSRRSSSSRTSTCAPPRRARRCPRRCRSPTPSTTSATRACSCSACCAATGTS